MWKRLINSVAQLSFSPHLTPLCRVGNNLLMLSWADEEIPTINVKLELELEPQEALIKSPT